MGNSVSERERPRRKLCEMQTLRAVVRNIVGTCAHMRVLEQIRHESGRGPRSKKTTKPEKRSNFK